MTRRRFFAGIGAAARAFAGRLAGSGRRQSEVAINVSGRRVVLRGEPGDPYLATLRRGRAFGTLEATLGRLPAEGLFLDVGANIGATALALGAAPRRKVLALEPHPVTFGHLKHNIAANGAGNVTPLQCAAGRAPGRLLLHEDGGTPSANHLVGDATLGRAGTVAVDVATVDDLVAAEGGALAFLKIDVEGFEIEVLEGARTTIARDRPSALVEFNLFTLITVADRNPRDLLAWLRGEFGHVYRFVGGKPYRIGTDAEANGFVHDVCRRPGATADLLATFAPL